MPTTRLLTVVLLSAALLTGCQAEQSVPVALPSAAPSPTPTPVVLTPVPMPVVDPQPMPRPSASGPLIGNDISWPECPIGTPGALPKKQGKGLPLPGPTAQFVIIGLTNGPGFYANPCFTWEVQQARLRGLPMAAYAFTTMPNPGQVTTYGGTGPWSSRTALGRMRNAAYAEAQVNVRSMRAAALRPPIVWIDVEPQPYLSPWGTDVVVNRAVIRAVQQSYADSGYRTGLYSSDNPWREITGGMRDRGPTWVTVGPRGRAKALLKCAQPTFSGGPALMAQWWDDEIQDKDLTCPGSTAAELFAP